MNDIINCPYCGQEIKAHAVRCRHCLSTLKDGAGNKSDSTAQNTEMSPGKNAAGATIFVIISFLLIFIIFFVSQNKATKDKGNQRSGTGDIERLYSDAIIPLTVSAYQNDAPANLPTFRVVEVEDLTIHGAIRYNLHVVIDEPVSFEQIQAITEHIVMSAKIESSFNAISVMYYDYVEYIGFGYTLGRADYAPGGDWGQANTVKTGDYTKMKFSYETRAKDWSKQLTPKEVAIWRKWEEIYDNIGKEDVAYVLVSEQYEISKTDIEDIIKRQITWTFMNMQ
jgi:hypothetical protein